MSEDEDIAALNEAWIVLIKALTETSDAAQALADAAEDIAEENERRKDLN